MPAPLPANTPAPYPSEVAQLVPPADPLPQCPCGHIFGRPQERNRHVRTHLPYWLYCPFPGCSWRGNRSYGLSRHWAEWHAIFGEAPRPEDCKIYDPDLVQFVLRGDLLIEEATG